MADYVHTRGGLLVPLAEFAAPAAVATAGPDTNEIASIRRDINRFIYGGALENLDETLRTRGRARGLKIYEELERDPHAGAVLDKRRLAVTSRDWQVDPASDSAQDKAAADLVERQLDNMAFDRITGNLLDATLKGYAVGEVMWEVRGREIWAVDVKARNQRRFVFDEDEQLRMLTRSDMLLGELMPPRKFIVHRFGSKDESPYGLGLGNSIFWPVFFKRQDIGFWLVFADKFGSPTALGKYPPGASKPDQTKLLNALNAIAQDAGIIVPEGMMVEFLEAARSGSIDTYERLARYMDEQISERVLGETMSTTSKAAGLGSNQASVHNEVRLEIAEADADLLSDTLNATLVRWICDYNFPGLKAYPKLYRSFEEDEDLEMRSKVDKTLFEMGYEPADDSYIEETYGGRWVRRKTTALQPGTPGAPGTRGVAGTAPAQNPSGQPQFAQGDIGADETTDQEDLAAGAEQLAGQYRQLLGTHIDDIIAMAEETGDLVLLRERLDDLLRSPPPAPVVQAVERASIVARLAGLLRGKK